MQLEDHYSLNPTEKWNGSNFLLELPMKWKLSFIAFEDSVIAGYIVSSLKNGLLDGTIRDYAFVHRTLVAPKYRGTSLIKNLVSNSINNAKIFDIGLAVWSCSQENRLVHEFYMRFADKVLGERLANGILYSEFLKHV